MKKKGPVSEECLPSLQSAFCSHLSAAETVFPLCTVKDEEVARVHVLIRKGDSVSFEGQKKVLIREGYTTKIIETDKPFYKPGETGSPEQSMKPGRCLQMLSLLWGVVMSALLGIRIREISFARAGLLNHIRSPCKNRDAQQRYPASQMHALFL